MISIVPRVGSSKVRERIQHGRRIRRRRVDRCVRNLCWLVAQSAYSTQSDLSFQAGWMVIRPSALAPAAPRGRSVSEIRCGRTGCSRCAVRLVAPQQRRADAHPSGGLIGRRDVIGDLRVHDVARPVDWGPMHRGAQAIQRRDDLPAHGAVTGLPDGSRGAIGRASSRLPARIAPGHRRGDELR